MNDYHVYACENTPEKITWYIDGEKIAEEENLYWHLPMSVTLTMELRPPLIRFGGVDGREPVAEASTPAGFPTEMAWIMSAAGPSKSSAKNATRGLDASRTSQFKSVFY